MSVEDKKLAADKLEEFTHPCGGSGWKVAVYRDFRDPNTPCPDEWEQTMYEERPHTCGKRTGGQGCDAASFPETEGLEYSKVCGRIKAYQFGTHKAFFGSVVVSHTFINDQGNDDFRVIWSFHAGITQLQVENPMDDQRCPCDGGNPFSSDLADIHFCE